MGPGPPLEPDPWRHVMEDPAEERKQIHAIEAQRAADVRDAEARAAVALGGDAPDGYGGADAAERGTRQVGTRAGPRRRPPAGGLDGGAPAATLAPAADAIKRQKQP